MATTSAHAASGTLTSPTFTDWHNQVETRDGPTEQELHTLTLNTSNWTTFDHQDGEPPSNDYPIKGDSYWFRLREHNFDNSWRYRQEVAVWASADRRMKQGVIKNFARQLRMSTVDTRDAFTRLMDLDLPRVGHPMEAVAFCVCALVVNEKAHRRGGDNVYHPQHQETPDRDFARLEADLIRTRKRVRKSILSSIYAKLDCGSLPRRPRSQWWPYFRHDNLTPQNSKDAKYDPTRPN